MIWLVLALWFTFALGVVAFLRGADERITEQITSPGMGEER